MRTRLLPPTAAITGASAGLSLNSVLLGRTAGYWDRSVPVTLPVTRSTACRLSVAAM